MDAFNPLSCAATGVFRRDIARVSGEGEPACFADTAFAAAQVWMEEECPL
jgi:hypothetical protein